MIRLTYTLGVFLLVLAVAAYYYSSPMPICLFTTDELHIDNIEAKTEQEVCFTLTNPTGNTVRIVGIQECCGYNACVRTSQILPLDVPPKSSIPFSCRIWVKQVGLFYVEFPCYIADPYQREIVLKVKGSVR